MTREEITQSLDEPLSHIADAWITLRHLHIALTKDKNVILEDIANDLMLREHIATLRVMEKRLLDAEQLYLPEHFERLEAE